jgi:hypothetical protein
MSGAFSPPSSGGGGGGGAPVTPTWVALSLQGAFTTNFIYPAPEYTKVNGVVFLRGYATHANSGYNSGSLIAQLPAGFRPSTAIRFSGDTYHINPGEGHYIDIGTNGNIVLHYNVPYLTAVVAPIVPCFGHIVFLAA